jgi:hypothetical protein
MDESLEDRIARIVGMTGHPVTAKWVSARLVGDTSLVGITMHHMQRRGDRIRVDPEWHASDRMGNKTYVLC